MPIFSDLLAELQKCTSTSKSQYGEMLEVSSSNGSVNDKQKQSSQIPKTVRMVKRDSKDRLRDGGSGAFNGKSWNEENTSIISPPPPPPPTLPRGNSQNVHNFLKNDDPPVDDALHNDVMEQASEKFAEKQSISQLSKASTLPRSFRAVEDLKDLRNNQHNIHGNGNGGPVYSGLVKPSMIHGGAGTKYNIGYRKKVCKFVYFLCSHILFDRKDNVVLDLVRHLEKIVFSNRILIQFDYLRSRIITVCHRPPLLSFS